MKILIAIDGSAASLESAKYFANLGIPNRLDVSVISAVGVPNTSLTGSDGGAYSQFVAESLKYDEQNFAAVARVFGGRNASLQHLIKHGHIGHCIVSAAEEEDADLIVMGSKGHTHSDHVLLGSVSEYVAMHASRSVLVVRPNSQPPADNSSLKITVAYDDSEIAKEVIRQLQNHEWAKNAEVQVLSVIPIHQRQSMDAPTVVFSNSPETIQEVTEYTERAANELRSSGIRATATVVEAKHIGDQVVGLSKLNQSDLIVMGARGQSGVARSLLGSVAHFILRHASQSVWVVRTT